MPVAGSEPGQSLLDEQTQRAPALPAAKVVLPALDFPLCLSQSCWALCAAENKPWLWREVAHGKGCHQEGHGTCHQEGCWDPALVPLELRLARRQRGLAGGCVPSTLHGTRPTVLPGQPLLSPQPDKGSTEQRVKPEPFICVLAGTEGGRGQSSTEQLLSLSQGRGQRRAKGVSRARASLRQAWLQGVLHLVQL